MHLLETASFKPIEVPDVTVRDLVDGDQLQAAAVLPWWAKHIAVHRDHCRKLIISADSSFGGKAWLVLFCKQQPWTVTTLEIRRVHIGNDVCYVLLEDVLDKDKFTFELFPLSYVSAVDVPINSADEVFVLQGAYVDGRRIMSRGAVVALDVLTCTLPAVSEKKKRKATSELRRSTHKPDAMQALLAQHPWLTEAEVKLAVGAQGGAAKPTGSAKRRRLDTDVPQEDGDLSSSSDDGRSDVAAEGGDPPEVRVFEADDLEQLRSLEERSEHKEMDFFVKMRGGAWTLQNKGEVADSAAFVARKGTASDWCTLFNFTKQKGLVYKKYGGRRCPHIFANEVAGKAQHFVDLWCAGGCSNKFRYYSAQVLEAYIEGLEFVEFASSDLSASQRGAVSDVQALAPL